MTIIDISAIISALSLIAIAAGPWLRGKADAPVVNVTVPEPVIQVTIPPPAPPHVVVEVVPMSGHQAHGPDHHHVAQPITMDAVEILKTTDDGHSHIGYRHVGHPDVQEALNNPQLAVRWPDGRIESQGTTEER